MQAQDHQFVMLHVLQAQPQVSIRNKQLVNVFAFKFFKKFSTYSDSTTYCGVHCSGDNLLQDQTIPQKCVQQLYRQKLSLGEKFHLFHPLLSWRKFYVQGFFYSMLMITWSPSYH